MAKMHHRRVTRQWRDGLEHRHISSWLPRPEHVARRTPPPVRGVQQLIPSSSIAKILAQ
jgi:hypothetical protein